MRKITSLLMLFCAFVGTAWAQLVETSTEASPKYYVIGSYSRGGVLTNAGTGSGLTHVALSDAGYWYFEKANEDGGVYIVNKQKDGESKVYVGSDLTASTTGAIWYILENGVNTMGYSISKTSTITSYSCIDANNGNTGVGTWAPSSSDWEGTTWGFFNIDALEDAVYNPEGLILRERSDRYINSITFNTSSGDNTITPLHLSRPGNGLCYINMTSSTIRVAPGEDITATLNRNGGWTNAYVYIDTDNNGFTAEIDDDGFTPAGDLVSYSFFSGDETNDTAGKNSAGEDFSGQSRNTIVLPSFKAPSTLGTYRLRVKHDWNSINPNGGNTNFMSNGGAFVDVTLEVIDPNIILRESLSNLITSATAQLGNITLQVKDANAPFYLSATQQGDAPISEVIDNNPATYYGSIWGGAVGSRHYWQVDLVDAANLAEFTFSYITRANGSDTPTQIDIKGSNDGSTFELIQSITEGLPTTGGSSYTSNVISNNGYRYIRFEIPSTTNNYSAAGNPEQEVTIAIAEFSMKNTDEGSYDQDLIDAIATAQAAVDNISATAEQLTEAYDALEAVINDKPIMVSLIANAKALAANSGSTVGYYTEASTSNLQTAITTAETALGNKNYSTTELQAAIDALEIVQPEEGVYYVIKSAMPNTDARSGQKIYVNNNGGMQFENATTMAHVFQFVDAGDNTFYIKSVERGTYLSTNKAHNGGQQQAIANTTANAKAVAIANMGRENVVSLIPVGGAMIHAQAAGSSVVAWNNTENTGASAWVIEEIDVTTVSHTLTIGEAGWASLVLGYNATIPADVKAYAVSAIGTGSATLTEITDAIPAGEAVLLNGAAGTYNFAVAESAAAVADNKLEGTVFNTNIAKAAWILGLNEGVAGLYTVTLDQEEGTAFTNNAFKAYLPKTSTEGALRLEIGTTSIENAIVGENGNAAIFDLSGRRVSKMQKGIYIVNGKKVYVK